MSKLRPSKFRIFLLLLLLSLLTAGILAYVYRDLVAYGWAQWKGQKQIIAQSVPMETFLQRDALSKQVRAKAKMVSEIKQFAIDSLGLAPTDAYTSVYDQQGKPLIWNLTACPPYELKAYQWGFPFLGSFGYKGFFQKSIAKAEERALQKQGYETYIYPVNAWSTLGWFDDPVFTSMLYKPPGSLANTLIHEMTHTTVFIKDDLTFNENFATFVGDMGAQEFLRYKYGDDSEELIQYLHNKVDYQLYSDHILRGARQLEELYASFDAQTPEQVKASKKKAAIKQIVHALDTVPFYLPELYLNHFREKPLPNNNYFLSYRRYRQKQDYFIREWRDEYDGDLKRMVLAYINKYE